MVLNTQGSLKKEDEGT